MAAPFYKPIVCPVLIERVSDLATLHALIDQAKSGRGQVVLLCGEAGIGKTTLVDAFADRAARRPNLRIARGQCVEGFGGKEAYYPMLEALGLARRQDEIRMTTGVLRALLRHLDIRTSFVIRHSSFVLRHSPEIISSH